LGVPTELHKYWISEHFMKEIKESIQELFQAPFSVQIDVKPGSEETSALNPASSSFQNAAPTAPNLTKTQPSLSIPVPRKPQQDPNVFSRGSGTGDHLNKDYTFSNFVVGRNNEFAHAACHNIAENPMGSDYNPLFICGPTGMGKTHLINAVANLTHG